MLVWLLNLVLIPLFISVTSQVIAEWLIRKYTDKRDKKQQPECLHRNRHKKPLGLPSQWFYNALGYSTLSHYDCNTLQGICHIKRNNPLVITNRISHRPLTLVRALFCLTLFLVKMLLSQKNTYFDGCIELRSLIPPSGIIHSQMWGSAPRKELDKIQLYKKQKF